MLLNASLTNLLLTRRQGHQYRVCMYIALHYINCLIKKLGINNSSHTPTTYMKEEILDNHRSVLCSLEFRQKIKKWIYIHSTGFLNYTTSLQTVLYCWGCQVLNETSFQIINMFSIGGQNQASELLRH